MYNLGMKNVVKNKLNEVVGKYKYLVVLVLLIFVSFLIAGYSKTDQNFELYLDNHKISLNNKIYVEEGKQYIHIDDLTSIFENNIYYDKISAKLIITTYNKLAKIDINDKNIVIKKEKDKFVDLSYVMRNTDNEMIVSKNQIYILSKGFVEGIIKKNRTEIYDLSGRKINWLIDAGSKVKVIVDDNLKNANQRTVNVEFISQDNKYYGYILKENVTCNYIDLEAENEKSPIILVKADEKIMQTTDVNSVDLFAINMYRLSGINTLAKLEYVDNIKDSKKVLVTINNGQKSANYDSDITTGMLNSETNRECIISKMLTIAENFAGINLDFSNFKMTDKEYYTQFIRELASVLHSKNKILVVNIPSTQLFDVEKIALSADYVVIQPYFERTLSSKTSGPISSLSYVEQTIKNVMDKSVAKGKIILGIPMYTILWTERRGTVINAEQYSMIAMNEYLKNNNITYKQDNNSGQNYINYTKGITTYRMWLEDQYSINKKAEFVTKYNLAGVSVYKSGMELKQIYESISKVLGN